MSKAKTRNHPAAAQQIRCAIYTRKSTDEGLEKEFNSLDAQRESGEAYIASQQHEGWTCVHDRYDDGGFTGGNMDRPALKRLMADIEAGKIDSVIVYKVDRLSRSLLDFAKIVETFDRHHISFASVTQLIDTATSMGRLMLNVLLSFAQFEREIISERTRDKIAAARRKGRWSGGNDRDRTVRDRTDQMRWERPHATQRGRRSGPQPGQDQFGGTGNGTSRPRTRVGAVEH